MKTNRILAAAAATILALAACTQDEWNENIGNTNGAEGAGAVVIVTPGEKPLAMDNSAAPASRTISNSPSKLEGVPPCGAGACVDAASKSFSTPQPERGGAQRAGGSPAPQGSPAQQGIVGNPLPPTGYSPFQAGEPEIVPTDGSAATRSAAPNCQLSTVNCQLPSASTRTAPTTGQWADGDRIIVTLQYFSDDAGTYPDLDAQGNPLPGTGALIDTDALGLPTSQTLTHTPETSDPDNNTIPAHWTADPQTLPLPPGARSLRASYRMVSAPDGLTATCEQMAGYLPSGDYPLSTLHSQPSTILGPDRGSGITMRVEDFEKELTGDWTPLYFGNLTLPDADMQAQIAASDGMKTYYAQMTRVYAALVSIEDPTQPVVLPAPVWKRQSTALILQDLRPGQTVDVEKTSVLGKPETLPLALPAHYASPADVRLHFMAPREVIVNGRGLLDKPHNSKPDKYFFALTDPAIALHQPLLRPRYERVEYWPGEQFVISADALYLGSETGDMQPVDGTDYDACQRYLTADNPRWVVSGGSKDRDEAITVTTNVSAALWRVARADADARIDVLLTEAGWLPQDRNTTGRGAFDGCTALRSLSAPQATTIEYGTFHQCSNLVYIDLPLATGNIDKSAFEQCSALKTITLPQITGHINDNAFKSCSALQSVSLPRMTGNIAKEAFYECSSLKTIDLPQMTGDISVRAFQGCIALTTIDLPQMAGDISNYAFKDCKSLPSLSLPMVGGISGGAFNGCESLKRLELTAPGIKNLSSGAFDGLDTTIASGFVLVVGKGQTTFCDHDNSNKPIDTNGDYVVYFHDAASAYPLPMAPDDNHKIRVEVRDQP